MKLINTKISGGWIIENSTVKDNRGSFSRVFCSREITSILGNRVIAQINYSITHKIGAIRGLHYQKPPHAEMKIVRCLKGRVFDVLVDLRYNSPTFLQWTGVVLCPEARNAFVIPEGCAHGFQVLEKDSELLYLHTEFYKANVEGAVRFNDPKVSIDWPLNPTDLSERDRNHPFIENNFKGLVL